METVKTHPTFFFVKHFVVAYYLFDDCSSQALSTVHCFANQAGTGAAYPLQLVEKSSNRMN